MPSTCNELEPAAASHAYFSTGSGGSRIVACHKLIWVAAQLQGWQRTLMSLQLSHYQILTSECDPLVSQCMS